MKILNLKINHRQNFRHMSGTRIDPSFLLTNHDYSLCNRGTVNLSLILLKVANLAGELGTICSSGLRIGLEGGMHVRGTLAMWGCDLTCFLRDDGSVYRLPQPAAPQA